VTATLAIRCRPRARSQKHASAPRRFCTRSTRPSCTPFHVRTLGEHASEAVGRGGRSIFNTRDPAFATTDTAYTYVGGDPVNISDPTGLMACDPNGGCGSPQYVAANAPSLTQLQRDEENAYALEQLLLIKEGKVAAPEPASSIGFRFDPGAAANAVVNVGRGVSFGLSDTIANWIQPGASCTVPQNSVDEFIGATASSIVAGEGAGRVFVALRNTLRAEAGMSAADQAAFDYATTPEKLDHIFAAKHNFDPLVQQFGSREAVVKQFLTELQGQTPTSGVFERQIVVGGQKVIVRGAVVNGVTKIGTAFTP
jgi:hypothetical protein